MGGVCSEHCGVIGYTWELCCFGKMCSLCLDGGIKQFLFLGDYLGELAFPQRTMEIIYSLKEKISTTGALYIYLL